jgi:hypothetical protein
VPQILGCVTNQSTNGTLRGSHFGNLLQEYSLSGGRHTYRSQRLVRKKRAGGIRLFLDFNL